jgi:hypothetical protein
MLLSQNRQRIAAATPQPIQEVMAPEQIRRIAAVEAAFVICGAVSDDEVFVSDVLDVATFILGDEPGPLDPS